MRKLVTSANTLLTPYIHLLPISKMAITSIQHNEIAEQFAELVVDGMDMKTLVQYVYDDLIEYYEKCDQEELREQIDNYDEDLYDELLENVTNETVLDTNNTGGKY